MGEPGGNERAGVINFDEADVRWASELHASSSRRIVSSRSTAASPVMSEQSVQIYDDRAFAATCTDEAQEPVNESCEPVLEPRHERNVHDEPHEPRNPAREPNPVCAEDRGAAVHGGHAPEVAVLPRYQLGAVSDTGLDDVSSMETGLKCNLGNAREVVEVHHVTDYEHLRVAG